MLKVLFNMIASTHLHHSSINQMWFKDIIGKGNFSENDTIMVVKRQESCTFCCKQADMFVLLEIQFAVISRQN